MVLWNQAYVMNQVTTDIKGPMPRARLDPRKANLRDRDLRLKMFTKLRVQLPTVS